MEWMKDIKAVIWDLDGTMYQELTFYRRYLRYLVEESKWEPHYETIVDTVENIFSGHHSFRVGSYYCIPPEKINTIDELIEFSGTTDTTQLSVGYLYGGDAWSVMNIISSRLNISPDKRKESFNRVREEMLQEPYAIEKKSTLFNEIEKLNVYKKVLMTNTYTQSAQAFVDYLGVSKLFDEIHYDSKKPIGIAEVIRSIQIREGLETSEILSIGDHAYNDLLPAKIAGCRTIHISPYPSEDSSNWDRTVKTIDELTDLLKSFNELSTMTTN
ncbi:FMN phosphatase YigB (HAD superfamily) [Mesobacillus stamsii]|uniref:FMN phosphatase YigB (HAD superfamily) n=2 Tax=Mesobacillus stamsii TaxID=225347 RepID=A0ABU0G2H6_9BACI|nr:FMN phosphatase YigB (HAD superfamily) [Mesobacillus stamsii]